MRKDLEVSRGNRAPMWNIPDIEDMMERAFRNPFSLLEDFRPSSMMNADLMQPNVTVDESEQAYLVCVDVPGVRKEDIKVDMSDNILTVSGERKHQDEVKEGRSHLYERSFGKFRRSFTLPSTVDTEHIEANVEDGVLRIVLPKSEQSKPRTIQVQEGKGGFFSKLIGSDKKEDKASKEMRDEKTH